MKISIEIPDVEIRQSFATMLIYMEPSDEEAERYKSRLREILENGEYVFDYSILPMEDQKKLKLGFGLMALETLMKEEKQQKP